MERIQISRFAQASPFHGGIRAALTRVVTTGIAHKEAGIGQIGAGIVRVPMACYASALGSMAERFLGH